jgi:hypothetical protein
VGRVHRPFPCRRTDSPQVHGSDPGVRVHREERGDHGEARREPEEGEVPAATAQHGGHEQEGQDGEPPQEDGAVEPRFGEAVCHDIGAKPLDGGRDHRTQQEELESAEEPEDALAATGPFVEGPVGNQQGRENERSCDDELREPLACVFRVGEAGCHLHEVASAEEVAELHEDEGHKEEIDHRQGGTHLYDAQGWSRGPGDQASAQTRSPQKSHQVAAREPGEPCDEDEAGSGPLEIDESHEIRDDAGEDLVGRDEECGEDCKEGGGQ